MSPSLAVSLLVLTLGQAETGVPRPAISFQAGAQFQTEIDRPLSASWANVELRDLLRKVSEDRRVAILLDRRIDPTIQLPLDLKNSSLREGVQDLARLVGAESRIAEPVMYVGPAVAARRLRTLMELRSLEITSRESPVLEKRRVELMTRRTVAWSDLDSPAEIVQRVADQFRLSIRNLDALPHDLWPVNALPGITAAEALSLILIQFDLTFAWVEEGKEIELVSAPEMPTVERRHRVKGRSAADALKLVMQFAPDLDARVDGVELVVRGLVEDHEAVASLVGGAASNKPVSNTGVKPIKQRLFTLKIDRVPVRVLMQKLEESEIKFEYDAAQLVAAGIDLDRPIKLDVEKASAADFFIAVFDPLGLSFEINHLTVKLKPKPKR